MEEGDVNGAVIIRWGNVVRGREAKALEVFVDAQAHYDAMAKDGRVADHTEWINVVGEQGGCMIVTGELSQLLAIQGEPATMDLLVRAGLIVEDLTTTVCAGGNEQSLGELMGRAVQIEQEMGYLTT